MNKRDPKTGRILPAPEWWDSELHELLEAAGINRKEMSKRLGICLSGIQRWQGRPPQYARSYLKLLARQGLKYMHTVNGRPAYFKNGKIYVATYTSQAIELASSLGQIKKERKISDANWASDGHTASEKDGYTRVQV